jgi:sec-independent protein translocase protein TatC
MDPVLAFLPSGESLRFFGLQDAFTLNLKISLWAGLLISSPLSLYELWAFCAPGLNPSERKRVPRLAFLALFLFLAGVSFAYFLVWPLTFRFFLGFSSETIRPLLAGDQYLSLVMGLTLVFALAFQLPLILMFLGKIGLITSQTLKKYRPYAIIAFFVIGAILTPPDAVSQCFLAGTLCLLYELSVFLVPKPQPEEPEELENEKIEEDEKEARAKAEKADEKASPEPTGEPTDEPASEPGGEPQPESVGPRVGRSAP